MGIFATTTGDFAAYGQPYLNGVKVAQKYFENAGVVTLNLTVRNTQDDPATNVTAMRDLSGNGIRYVLSYDGSPPSLAAAPVAQATSTLFMTGATSVDIPKAGSWVWQAPTQTAPIAAHGIVNVLKKFKARRVAIIEDNNDFGSGTATYLKPDLKAAGMAVVTEQRLDPTSSDYGSQVSQVVNAHPDAIAAATIDTSGAQFVKLLRAAGTTAPAVGPNAWVTDTFSKLDGGASGVYAVTDFLATGSGLSSIARKFISLYRSAYGSEPNTYAASGFDQVLLLVSAMQKAGSTDPTKVQQALGSIHVDGATGRDLHFDASRSIKKSALEVKLQGSTWVTAS